MTRKNEACTTEAGELVIFRIQASLFLYFKLEGPKEGYKKRDPNFQVRAHQQGFAELARETEEEDSDGWRREREREITGLVLFR